MTPLEIEDDLWLRIKNKANARQQSISEFLTFLLDENQSKWQTEQALLLREKQNQKISELICDYAAAYQFTSDDIDTARLEWVFGAFEEITGHPVPEAFSKFSLSEPVHPDDLSLFQSHQRRLHSGKASVCEFRIFNKQGQVRWLLSQGMPEWDDKEQKVARVFVGVQDITERKQAEEKLRVSEAKFRDLIETSIEGIILFQDGRFVFANPSMGTIVGYSVDQLLAMSPQQVVSLVHPDDQEKVRSNIRRRLSGLPTEPIYEHRLIRTDGQVRIVEIYASLTTHQGKPAIQATYLDITDRRQTEEALRINEAVLRLVTDNMLDMVLHTDKKGIIQYVSPSVQKLWELTPEELIGTPFSKWFEAIHPDDRKNLAETFANRLATGDGPAIGVYRFQHRSGETRWNEYTVASINQEDGSLAGFTYVIRDINQRMQAILALQESEGRLRQAMNVGRLGIWEWDITTDRTLWMGDIYRMYGISPEAFTGKGEDYLGFTLPEDQELQRENIAQAFARGLTEKALIENKIEIPAKPNQFRILRQDGTLCYVQGDAIAIVDEEGNPQRMIGVLQDVTEQRAVEAAMQQAQKLESLGVLAGSVAHDFNNLLTSILTNASLMELNLDADYPVRSYLETIIDTAERAADITHQLLAYSGKGRLEVTEIDLNALVLKNTKLLQATIPKNITLSFESQLGLPLIEGDSGQIQQVIMNLMINAADAYGGQKGQVKLETTIRHITDQDVGKWESIGYVVQAGDYICLTVEDEGYGMDNSTVSRIFDPFFTTKETGRGLGLAAVQGIIRGHRGVMRVTSAPNMGTSFEVLFPVSPPRAKPVTAARSAAAASDNYLILVVDDEEGIREAACDILTHHGFQVLSVENGEKAIALCQKHIDEISLILLDMTMPTLSGMETLKILQQQQLNLPIVLMSGYDEQTIDSFKPPTNVVGFLKKPFRMEKLVDTINAALRN